MNIVALHFFENHLNGVIRKSFSDLVHLKYLNIFNDGRLYEQKKVYHRNTLWKFEPDIIAPLVNLE